MPRRQVGTKRAPESDIETAQSSDNKSEKENNLPKLFIGLAVFGVVLYIASLVLEPSGAVVPVTVQDQFTQIRNARLDEIKGQLPPPNPPPEAPVVGAADPRELTEAARIAMQQRLTTPSEDGYPTGYVRVPKLVGGKKDHYDDGRLHIIFSSGCNYFQHWQSEMLLATAKYVGQRGRVTRIVSGCHDKKAEKINHKHQTFPKGTNDLLVPFKELNRSVNDNFGLYITPTFEGAMHFPWINKPSSIDYFIQHARPDLDRLGETVIAILDPDFVFLEALTQQPLDVDSMLSTVGTLTKGDNVVRRGRPVAQHYGLGGGWVSRFDVASIAGKDSHATTYSAGTAAKHFAVGPPLMLHVDDLADLAPIWRKNMVEVLKVEKDILADMWAYCMAAAHLKLEHTILDQFMLSTWGNSGQSFPWVNKLPELSCLEPKIAPGHHGPTFIHMASNFKAPESKKWMFHKGHVPAKILDCGTPLIINAPDDLWGISKSTTTKQCAFTLCNIVKNLNRVATDYKQKFCKPEEIESRHLVRLIQSKELDRGCNQAKDKWCYPLAQIEGLDKNWRAKLD